MNKYITGFIATGAYTGYSPVMPGTCGTVIGVLVAWLIAGLGTPVQAGITIAVIIVSIYISGEAIKIYGAKDPSKVVIDEIAGYLVAIFLIPFTALNATIVFLLFRFFDIVKPWPVSYADRRVAGGLGVTLDDLIAGVYAAICARLALEYLVPLLG